MKSLLTHMHMQAHTCLVVIQALQILAYQNLRISLREADTIIITILQKRKLSPSSQT